jgi:hypothetical protein
MWPVAFQQLSMWLVSNLIIIRKMRIINVTLDRI